MKWKPNTILWNYFHLTNIDKPFSRKVFLNLGDDLLVFKKNNEVIKFYQSKEDLAVFCLSYDFEASKWMFWLHDETDLSWIPEDGCEWEFNVLDVPGMKIIHNDSGTLEIDNE